MEDKMEKQDTTDKVLGHFKTTGIGKWPKTLLQKVHARKKKHIYKCMEGKLGFGLTYWISVLFLPCDHRTVH